MAKKDLFDSIEIPEPCPKNWDAMVGDDKSRFCGNCERDVYNLSEMTKREAKRLILQSNVNVCVRLEKDTYGRAKTLKRKLHQITRQMPIAAGVLSASLAMTSSADAQKKQPRPPLGKPAIRNILDAQSTASISGTVSDEIGAVIPNAQIVLFDAKNKIVQQTKSNEEGFYELKNIKAGVYKLEAEMTNFKRFVQRNLEIESGEKKELKIELKDEKLSETIGVLADVELLEIKTDETKVSDKIQTRRIESLPVIDRNRFVLGLTASRQSKPAIETPPQDRNASQIFFKIFDPTDSVVPNQTVELVNEKTKREFSVSTDQEGVARFYSIPRGRYDLIVSGNGFNKYHAAVRIKEQIEPTVEIRLDVGSFVGSVIFDWSEIPLFRAVAQDDNETVKRLVNSGFFVDTRDENGATALHVAVQHGNLKIVRFLLDKKAKPEIKDKSKRTALAMIFESFEDDANINREIVRLLISKGANINVRDEDSQTLLMRACEDDDLENVRFLLNLGANPQIKDDEGETAFEKTDSAEIKQMLVSYRAEKN